MSICLDPSQSQLVPYKKNTVKREMSRYYQQWMNHSFQVEFSTYRLTQKQTKYQVRMRLSHHRLPIQAFHNAFSQIAEITKPHDKMKLVFELFRNFSKHPNNEICGRFLWSYYEGQLPAQSKNHTCYLNNTMCMATRDALLSSIFGLNASKKMEHIPNVYPRQLDFNKILNAIEKNGQLLAEQTPPHFFVYSFGLSSTRFPGHAFLVLQSLNEQGKVQYNFYQSYFGQFTLKMYLDKNTNVMYPEEFRIFFKGLQDCLLSEKWSDKLDAFYTKYFNVSKGFKIGISNPCSDSRFSLEWGLANIENLLIQQKHFASFTRSPSYPRVYATKR